MNALQLIMILRLLQISMLLIMLGICIGFSIAMSKEKKIFCKHNWIPCGGRINTYTGEVEKSMYCTKCYKSIYYK